MMLSEAKLWTIEIERDLEGLKKEKGHRKNGWFKWCTML
jgi:hypothetical protein